LGIDEPDNLGNHIVPQGKGRIINSGEIGKPIKIGNDVWIGANCLILAGVQIGEGAVVAAGSVVKRDVEAFSVVAGYPARRLRSRLLNRSAEGWFLC
jgi:acetyltransferase-like isoleucine patch superfamily enzyme